MKIILIKPDRDITLMTIFIILGLVVGAFASMFEEVTLQSIVTILSVCCLMYVILMVYLLFGKDKEEMKG